jgi:succinate dehydrogenase / fumarate reductase, cytochrome b subunit
MAERYLPSCFIGRRVHSLFGAFLSLFLFFHLFTNSQAGLLIGEDGRGFIRSVNGIHEIPYLPLIELAFLGLPILVHALWGLKYLRTAEYNSFGGDGRHPYLPEYGRNRAYTWQRITSWILLAAILLHVAQMRFYDAPVEVRSGAESYYIVKVSDDPGLSTLSQRLHFTMPRMEGDIRVIHARDFGTAELLMVRDTFKSPWMMFLYTIFVWAACFHAFNGLWSFSIAWGIAITSRSQALILKVTTFLMLVVILFGMASIYLTYWINLRQ